MFAEEPGNKVSPFEKSYCFHVWMNFPRGTRGNLLFKNI